MWPARPIFISGTFADMQAERDHLRTHVFPELEERLRKRRHNLEWVDLRLGVSTASLTESEARELQVLKVCLAEVKRSEGSECHPTGGCVDRGTWSCRGVLDASPRNGPNRPGR